VVSIARNSIVVRYAESDDDVIAIHRFLCVVAAPGLPGPIDGQDSAREVWRVVTHEVALMAIADGRLVGTLGLVRAPFWWNNKLAFLANRWFFALPGSHAGKPLLKEARAIARESELELHIFDERRERLMIYNKSKNRGAAHVLRQ